MKTIHLISHTHWDREWYRTFQQFRLQLVHLVDGLLDILADNRNFKHFMLDGQTIILDDYLLMRPEAESALTKHIRSGRVLIGPWHILPDMFLVSPEAHIRNLLAGDRGARRFGPKMMIGYMPDSFGHIGQMPQILQGFGIDNACLWRGLDDQPAEFWWQAPDGTRVLMLYLRDSYSNGASLNASSSGQFTDQIQHAADSLVPHSAANNLLVMYGTDHMEPPLETAQAVKAANKGLKGYRLVHSTLPKYFAAVKSEIINRKSEIPTVVGELRSSKRMHLLPGILSTRMWIKQRNHACENLLEKWAEPFSTFASLQVEMFERSNAPTFQRLLDPASIVRQAWQQLMECHPHDSICGCSIDQVHEEMRPRFDQVEQIGEVITKQSLDALAEAVNTSEQSLALSKVEGSVISYQSAIVVFNPLSTTRTDIVSSELSLPAGVSNFEIIDEAGNLIPHQAASGKASDLVNVRVRREELGSLLENIHEGRMGDLAIQDLRFERLGAELRIEAIFAENANPNIELWNASLKTFNDYLADDSIETFHIHARSPDSANITFAASNVPALGWKTFYVCGKESVPAEIHISPWMQMLAPLAKFPVAQKLLANIAHPKAKPPYIIENELFTVELNRSDRTFSVTDKTTGKVHHGLNRFVDSGDCGDEYNFSPPPADLRVDSATLRDVTFTRGPVQQTMTVSLALKVPATLSADRKSRSAETVELSITTTVTLTNSVPRVDIHTRVDNRAKDHRLRVHFPAPVAVDSADYDGHFEIVKRPLGIPAFDDTWAEQPRPETYQSAFTSISDGQNTLTIANRGLPEVEALRTRKSESAEIAITLLRSVGWLSRDDFSTRKNHAGPFLETPKAQMIGEWEFDYSVIVGQVSDLSYQQAWNFESPLRAATTGIHAGTLPASGSFVRVDNASFVVSAVKETEDGKGWVVRGYNIGDDKISVTLTPWRKFKKAERVNMAEEMVSRLKVGRGGEVTVKARGHEVVTVKFSK